MNNEKYIFLGGGGFAIELYQYMHMEGKNIIGYYAMEEDENLNQYIPWLGFEGDKSDEDLDHDAYYIVAVRLIRLREKLIDFIDKHNLKAGSFISEKAYISDIADLGKGLVAFPNAMITGNPKIGDYFFIDSLAIVSHGDIIGDNVIVGPAAVITGDCIIGDNVTFGVNSCCLPGTRIGSNVEIAIGTFPQRRVPDDTSILSLPGKKFGKKINKNFN